MLTPVTRTSDRSGVEGRGSDTAIEARMPLYFFTAIKEQPRHLRFREVRDAPATK
jgi:hypothetical protein